MKKDTLLTKKQVEVLRLRAQGYSQTEIAKKFGTSRANISAMEKTALKNIQKAKKTLELVKIVEAPTRITIKPNTDLNDVVKMIYEKADAEGIWMPHSFPSLANIIQSAAGDKIKGRRVLRELEVAITKDGSIIVS